MLTTQDSLKSTQCALQESKMEIEQLHDKLQRSYLPSYTPFNHLYKDDCILDHMEESHEMHLVLHVLEDGAYKLDGNQALDIFQLFLGECLFSMEDSDDITLSGSTIDEEGAAISWMNKYYKRLIHSFTLHNSISSISGGNENWEKGFSWLVPHEE